MYCAIIKFRNTKFDPTQVKFDIKKPAFNEEHIDEDNGSKCMVPVANGTNQLTYFNKKKPIETKCNYHNSNKELFDWDSNLIKMHQTGLLEPQNLPKDDPRNKYVFQSKVFDATPVDINLNHKHKTVQSCFIANGDVITWKGNNSRNQEQKQVIRRDPNIKLQEAQTEEKMPIKKINTMFQSSNENVLNHTPKTKNNY